ncbi:MAG: DUF86 domain-containing protein [Gammaproteobacteria bacterium HGW-Gammaproteobacteria-1]|jgi:uncharacterized protein with HEPN domain|nr:MAG: DUF86 domain-containing protein [Gammaproteobacteria bacterium HGW-Gammaproteobacteria-1]
MKVNRLEDYIEHMLEASRLALSYVADLDRKSFLADKRTQQAVILNIVVIGEAATKISNEYPDFVARHSAIPWKNMKGMRNRIAHGYFDIDLDITALPPLVEQLTALRTSTPSGD